MVGGREFPNGTLYLIVAVDIVAHINSSNTDYSNDNNNNNEEEEEEGEEASLQLVGRGISSKRELDNTHTQAFSQSVSQSCCWLLSQSPNRLLTSMG